MKILKGSAFPPEEIVIKIEIISYLRFRREELLFNLFFNDLSACRSGFYNINLILGPNYSTPSFVSHKTKYSLIS